MDTSDNLSLTSPDGLLVLQFRSGIGGVGYCCGPTAYGPVVVVDVQKVFYFGTAGSSTSLSDRADGVYVSDVITSDVEATFTNAHDPSTKVDKLKGYIPQVVLHNAKKLSILHTYDAINGGIEFENLIPGKYANIDKATSRPGDFIFGTTTFDLDTKQKTYATLSEAKQQLQSDTFTQARAILLSAKYQ